MLGYPAAAGLPRTRLAIHPNAFSRGICLLFGQSLKEVLNAEDFAIYSKLRELRREVATREGVPVYAIFANSQPAAMVEGKVRTEAELERIDGVGEARVKKYGEAFAALIRQELEARENRGE